MTLDDDLRQAVDERLAETIRQHRDRRDGRRRRLAELTERRTHGLARLVIEKRLAEHKGPKNSRLFRVMETAHPPDKESPSSEAEQ